MNLKNTILAACLLCAVAAPLAAQTAPPPTATQSVDPHFGETKAHRDARMKWWREARFGMFIHWGLYAQLAGSYDGKETNGAGEWIMHDMKIPVAAYAANAKDFDPVKFDADTWVSIAKAAGMKYIVMTAKHHEGFAMFHTKVDGYNIYDATPFKRDPIAEMTAACKKAGIKFGVYYSQNLDWHHPGGGTAGPSWDPAQTGDFAAYVKNISAPQVRELITEYHPAVLWWDINGPFTPDEVRQLTDSFSQDPGLIYNNRLGGGVPGDYGTPEQYIPATGLKGDWETCMTINNTWGYKKQDTDFKSGTTLLHNLIDIASKGGNYLLNVGPDPTGVIPAPEVARLQDMGRWMKVNGSAIYGTTASVFKRLPFDGRVTVKGDTLNLIVFTWPDSGLTLSGLQTPVRDARALATGQHLTVSKAADGTLTISKPDVLDPDATVITLRLQGKPVVDLPDPALVPAKDGSYALSADTAVLEGSTLQVEGNNAGSNLGYWTNAQDAAHWQLSVPAAAATSYKVGLEYSCEPDSAGSTFKLQVDGVDSGLTGTVPATTSWTDYHTMVLDGTLALTAGTHTLRIVPITMPKFAVMNLRQIILTPIAP